MSAKSPNSAINSRTQLHSPDVFRLLVDTVADYAIFLLDPDGIIRSWNAGAENRTLHPFPCVILLDIKLPRRSGFEVLEWIRSQESTLKRVPVIMLTSSNHHIDVNKAYELGVNSYLVKPSNSSELEQLVSTFRAYWVELNQGPTV
jgi:CheY-like chemotaxis protein